MTTAGSGSELRVVLLGNSWSRRSSVGNFILGEDVFSAEEEPNQCLRVKGQLDETQTVLIINCPDLLHPAVKLTQFVENCVRLSAPGPHVFLLVLQPEDFTEEHKLRICRVLHLFSDRSFEHSLVLISTPRDESSGENHMNNPALKDVIKMCQYRYVKQEKLEPAELLTRMGQTAKENSGEHLSCGVFEAEDPGLYMSITSKRIKPALNLVLCGRRGAGKTSAVKAILGQTELHSASNSSECVKHQGDVCGRQVFLVELPALYGEPQETMMEESFRCISLCDPEGVHAFILVLPVGPLTDEDKRELQSIQNTFSSRVNDFTVILFTVESDPTDPAVVNFVRKNRDVQELCQSCGGRSVVLNIRDRQQVSELMETVEKMNVRGSGCFTRDMFTKGLMSKIIDHENTKTKVIKLAAFIIFIFTRGDKLSKESYESFMTQCPEFVKPLISDCGRRYDTNWTRACDLLIKEEIVVKEKRESCYNTEEFIQVERRINEEDGKSFNEDLRRKHKDLKTLMEKMNEQRREIELREKDERINKECEEMKKEQEEEGRRRQRREEALQQQWRRKLEAWEKTAGSERQRRENAEKKVELCGKQMETEREKIDLRQHVRQDKKQNLDELKTCYRKPTFVLLLFALLIILYLVRHSE